MSYSIRWGGSPEDVMIAFAGVVPVEELLAAFDEVRASPNYHCATDDIRRRAEAVVAYAHPDERHRVAVVVDRKLPYGLMRMREAHTTGRINTDDRVFYDLESAREWLAQ